MHSETTSTIRFSRHALKTAAALWAQYLPGVSSITPKKRNEVQHQSHNLVTEAAQPLMIEMNQRQSAVTAEQVNTFINALHIKIFENSEKNLRHTPAYLSFGNKWSYEPPISIDEALEEAGIECNTFGRFPQKEEMRIYANGHIQFCNTITQTDPQELHYDASTPFLNDAKTAVIVGRRFKLFEISYTPGDSFYEGTINGPFSDVTRFTPSNHFSMDETGLAKWVIDSERKRFNDELKEEKDNIKYLKIDLKDFKGTEDELIRMSNEELCIILKDIDKIKLHFKSGSHLRYTPKVDLTTLYTDIGNTTAKLISNNYYQRVTDVVRIFYAPKSGTIIDSCYGINLDAVKAGSLLICDKANTMSCIENPEEKSLEVIFCAAHTPDALADLSESSSTLTASALIRNHPIWKNPELKADAISSDITPKL